MGPGGPCQEDDDVCEGEVALPRTGSDEPVNSVIRTSRPGGPGGPCDEEGDVSGVMLPCTGPVPTRLSLVLLVQSAREAPVMRPGRWWMLPGMR